MRYTQLFEINENDEVVGVNDSDINYYSNIRQLVSDLATDLIGDSIDDFDPGVTEAYIDNEWPHSLDTTSNIDGSFITIDIPKGYWNIHVADVMYAIRDYVENKRQ
jgi:hypothetical protein